MVTSCRPRTCACSRPGSRRRAGPAPVPPTRPDPTAFLHRGRQPIGVSLGVIGVAADWWLESAGRLETSGYAGIWAWDHFMGRGAAPTTVLECWTMLALAAARTERMTVGSFVTNVMNRHPALLARMVGTLQVATGGRAVLGIGIGGHPAEHEAYGIDFPSVPERVARLDGGAGRDPRALERWARLPAEPVLPARERRCASDSRAAPADRRRWRDTGRRAAGGPGRRRLDGLQRQLHRARARLPGGARGRRASPGGHGRGARRPGRGWLASGDSLRASPWVEQPLEELDRWRALGADGVVVQARTPADVDALVRAAERW